MHRDGDTTINDATIRITITAQRNAMVRRLLQVGELTAKACGDSFEVILLRGGKGPSLRLRLFRYAPE